MATEKRLIDAIALMNVLKENHENVMQDPEVKSSVKWRETVVFHSVSQAIRHAPTEDAVEVVRCKDCKHWKPIAEHIPHMECDIFCGAYEHGYPTNADDFCSYGERRTDGAEG